MTARAKERPPAESASTFQGSIANLRFSLNRESRSTKNRIATARSAPAATYMTDARAIARPRLWRWAMTPTTIGGPAAGEPAGGAHESGGGAARFRVDDLVHRREQH